MRATFFVFLVLVFSSTQVLGESLSAPKSYLPNPDPACLKKNPACGGSPGSVVFECGEGDRPWIVREKLPHYCPMTTDELYGSDYDGYYNPQIPVLSDVLHKTEYISSGWEVVTRVGFERVDYNARWTIQEDGNYRLIYITIAKVDERNWRTTKTYALKFKSRTRDRSNRESSTYTLFRVNRPEVGGMTRIGYGHDMKIGYPAELYQLTLSFHEGENHKVLQIVRARRDLKLPHTDLDNFFIASGSVEHKNVLMGTWWEQGS